MFHEVDSRLIDLFFFLGVITQVVLFSYSGQMPLSSRSTTVFGILFGDEETNLQRIKHTNKGLKNYGSTGRISSSLV